LNLLASRAAVKLAWDAGSHPYYIYGAELKNALFEGRKRGRFRKKNLPSDAKEVFKADGNKQAQPAAKKIYRQALRGPCKGARPGLAQERALRLRTY